MTPLPLTDPNDIPSLDFVFGHNSRLMKIFRRLHIESVTPVMLLPKPVLMEFPGVGERTATYIIGCLTQHNLGHHNFNEKLGDFIDRQFGCIEDAPVSVLNVVTLRDNITTRPYYTPLQLLQLIEQEAPHFTVRDLLQSTEDELIGLIEERVVFGPVLNRLKGDIVDLNWRLAQWDPELFIGSMEEIEPRSGHLSLVVSQ